MNTSTRAALEMAELLDDEEHQWHYEAAKLIRALVAERKRAEKLIDAAIVWANCPSAGGYKNGPAVEDTCEELGAAVNEYLGLDLQTFPDEWWTLEQMRGFLENRLAARAAQEEKP